MTDGTSASESSADSHSPPPRPNANKSVFAKARAGFKVGGLVLFFVTSSIIIFLTELIGYPITWFSPELYHLWIDLCKQSFCILLVLVNAVGMSSKIHVGGEKDVGALVSKDPAGLLDSKFGDRAVIIGNHQLYNDWMFLWWTAYTSSAHGGFYIVLKESVKKLPIFGLGMRLFNFIFLARDWSKDEKTMTDAMKVISKQYRDYPAWILIFPEGTVFSRVGVEKSQAFAEKAGKSTYKRVLLPRSRGLRFILDNIDDSIEYLYDATVHYSGIPEGTYGEEYYSLSNVYFHNIHAKDVYMYWRRYKIADIPFKDEAKFSAWLDDVWQGKDDILERIAQGQSSFAEISEFEPLTVPVKLKSNLEVFSIFSVLLNVLIILNLLRSHGYPLIKDALASSGLGWSTVGVATLFIAGAGYLYSFRYQHSTAR